MKKSYWLLLVIYLLAVTLRWLAVKDGYFPFWFDVGRDAIVSRQIIEQKDLKIQGPNASGTQDTVYHGVLYYYIIGPLYTLFAGDPQLVVMVLSILTASVVVVIYFLTRQMTQSTTTALLAAFLTATSYDAIRAGTWLSNPVLAAVGIPLFFLLLWQVFFVGKSKWFPLLTLVIGFNQQAVIFFGLEWFVVLVAWWYSAQTKQKISWRYQTVILGFVTYLVAVSSMILAQLKAYQAGIFTLAKLAQYSSNNSSPSLVHINGVAGLYLTKFAQALLPSFPVVAILLIIGFWLFLRQKNSQHQFFWLLVLTSPLWLLGVQYRNMIHSFIGLEAMLMILFAWWLTSIKKLKFGKVIMVSLIGIFLISNIIMWRQDRRLAASPYFVPTGTYYRDLLAAIDFTYQQAAGQPFSISTVTNPYGYNSLWSYLYSWYGLKKYGYLPSWYGPDQTGLFGENLLTATASPSVHHFSIWEPGPGISEAIYWTFDQEQKNVGSVIKTDMFGTLKVETRGKSGSS